MNPLNAKNLVAKIIQVYACLNAAAGAILALTYAEDVGGIIAFLIFAMILVVSFLLYSLGEIVELLHQIKENTAKANEAKCGKVVEELPEI